MSILIKGMEMPKSCKECIFKSVTGVDRWKCRVLNTEFMSWDAGWGGEETRREDCPLAPVPPHGRLIDADALKAEGWELQMFRNDEYGCSIICRSLDSEDIPTIIEAEEGET